jgi:3-oxoacyl-[acyl-carrier protein] reductase
MILSEQTVIITGAAGDIGSYLAKGLGTKVQRVIAIDINRAGLDKIKEDGQNITCYTCDLTQVDEVNRLFEGLYEEYPASVLINNAGLIHSELLINLMSRQDRKHSVELWRKTLDINLNTVFYVTSSVVDQMVRKKVKGLVINMSSISANGNLGQTAYAAAKAAINAMTITWAKELGMFGIRSTAIAPGFFDTSSTRTSLSEAVIKKWEKNIPVKRMGQLEELLKSVQFIIENDYYNGKILEVDGGLRI